MQSQIEAPLNSITIQKYSKEDSDDLRLFVCGECKTEYQTYSALYLHIRRKHNGVRPPNTILLKSKQTTSQIKSRIGRPKKVRYNIHFNVSFDSQNLLIYKTKLIHQLK